VNVGEHAVVTGKCESSIGSQLQTLFQLGAAGDLSDGYLLKRFVSDRSEPGELAFAALVERHGPMVDHVCRSILADVNDCHDAFQATFLVLVKRARSLWVRDSLAPWLHRVALHTALYTRGTVARRRRHEAIAARQKRESQFMPDVETAHLLHQEIDRLPNRFRQPLVLCELEGRTHAEAARALGCPVGTIKSRLTRGRARLRDRLTGRGIGPDATLGGLAICARAVQLGTCPRWLVRATVESATQLTVVQLPGSGSAILLSKGVMHSMLYLKLVQVVPVVCLVFAGAVATGLAAFGPKSSQPLSSGHALSQAASEKQDPSTIEAKRSDLPIAIKERGTLHSARNSDVICEIEGWTTIVRLLAEGSHVKKGDLVAELDSSSIRDTLVNQEIAIKRAEAEFQTAKKNLEIAKLAYSEELEGRLIGERDALQGEIKQAEANVKRMEARLERARGASRQMRQYVGQVRTAAEILALLDVEERIEDAEIAMERDQLSAIQSRRKLELLENTTRVRRTRELEVALAKELSEAQTREAHLALARSKFDKLKHQLDKCKLFSPTDGMVVYAQSRNPDQQAIEEGAIVRERQKIFSVPDLSEMLVSAKVGEALIHKVVPGQRVSIHVDAFPDQTFPGRVKSVAPLPDSISLRNGQKVYDTAVEFEKPFDKLRPGMTSVVEIVINTLQNVITVPTQCLVPGQGDLVVVGVSKPAGVEWRPVQIGQFSDGQVEVKAGLSSGEKVILKPLEMLSAEDIHKRVEANQTPSADRR
jgi:RND family efflux transporter MFP subunit